MYLILLFYIIIISEPRVKKGAQPRPEIGHLNLDSAELLMRIKSYHLEGGLIDQDRVYSKRINAKDRREKLQILGHSRPTIVLQYFVLFYSTSFSLGFWK